MSVFFRKNVKSDPKIGDLVPKVTQTGYIFWDINDDLGKAAESIMKATPQIRMAYGYARRAAAAALYLQGLLSKDTYSHVCAIFKALQHQTEQTVDFQERAGAESIEFMQSYHYLISGLLVKKLIAIAQNYEVPSNRLSDAELFSEVLDTIHEEQELPKRE